MEKKGKKRQVGRLPAARRSGNCTGCSQGGRLKPDSAGRVAVRSPASARPPLLPRAGHLFWVFQSDIVRILARFELKGEVGLGDVLVMSRDEVELRERITVGP